MLVHSHKIMYCQALKMVFLQLLQNHLRAAQKVALEAVPVRILVVMKTQAEVSSLILRRVVLLRRL